MKIQIDAHTLERMEERGASREEVEEVIREGAVIPAKYGRFRKTKIFEFQRKRHGKFYEQKRVEVVYTMEEDTAITVTVYVFYGKWEEEK